jgi:general stress protein 26
LTLRAGRTTLAAEVFMATATDSALDHLKVLISGIDVAMLTTVDRSGRLHSRPMVTLSKPVEGALWFFTQAASHIVDDVNANHPVNLSFVDSERGRYVSVSGRARVVRDKGKKNELWERRVAKWLPGGPDNAEVVLLRVEADEAEFWDSGEAREVTASVEIRAGNGQMRNERISFH